MTGRRDDMQKFQFLILLDEIYESNAYFHHKATVVVQKIIKSGNNPHPRPEILKME